MRSLHSCEIFRNNSFAYITWMERGFQELQVLRLPCREISQCLYTFFSPVPLVAQQNPFFPVYFQMLWLSLAPSCFSFHKNKLQLFPLVLKPIAQEMGAHIRTRRNLPAICSLVHPSNALVCSNCIYRPLKPQHD